MIRNRRTFTLLVASSMSIMAQAPTRQAPPTVSTSPAKSASAPAKKAVLPGVMVTATTDAACVLTIDGKRKVDMSPEKPTRLSLSHAAHTLEALSSASSQDRWEGRLDLAKTVEKPTIDIRILPIQNKRIEEERRAAEGPDLVEGDLAFSFGGTPSISIVDADKGEYEIVLSERTRVPMGWNLGGASVIDPGRYSVRGRISGRKIEASEIKHLGQ